MAREADDILAFSIPKDGKENTAFLVPEIHADSISRGFFIDSVRSALISK